MVNKISHKLNEKNIYKYLVNFSISGLYLYMLVVETFTAENIKLKVYTTVGWGKFDFVTLFTTAIIIY